MRYFLLVFALLFSSSLLKADPNPANKILNATILLNDARQPDFQAAVTHLKSNWKIKADSVNIADKTLVFSSGGMTVMAAWLDYPAPKTDLLAMARLNWLWKTADKEAVAHRSQLVVSVITSPSKVLEGQKLLTKFTGALLEQNSAAGVYIENQYLLLSREFYLAAAQNLLNNNVLPLYCWIYFGILGDAAGNSSYTYGLAEFGLPEMEIVKSANNLAQVHSALYDAAMVVVQYQLKPATGEKITTLENQEFIVTRTRSAFTEGDALRLDF